MDTIEETRRWCREVIVRLGALEFDHWSHALDSAATAYGLHQVAIGLLRLQRAYLNRGIDIMKRKPFDFQ